MAIHRHKDGIRLRPIDWRLRRQSLLYDLAEIRRNAFEGDTVTGCAGDKRRNDEMRRRV